MCKSCSVSAATQQALAKEKVGSLCLVPSKHTVHTDMTRSQTHGRGINTATKSDTLLLPARRHPSCGRLQHASWHCHSLTCGRMSHLPAETCHEWLSRPCHKCSSACSHRTYSIGRYRAELKSCVGWLWSTQGAANALVTAAFLHLKNAGVVAPVAELLMHMTRMLKVSQACYPGLAACSCIRVYLLRHICTCTHLCSDMYSCTHHACA